MTDIETLLAAKGANSKAEYEMLRHDYETVMASAELKARLDSAIAWVLRAADAKDREERIKFIQNYARAELDRIREGN